MRPKKIMSDLEYTQKMREYNLLVSTKEYLLDDLTDYLREKGELPS